MDSSQDAAPFTAVEFCAGYAGIHLGLKRAIPSLRVIAFSEIEAFACANLVAKMEAGLLDSAPVWTDLKTFPSAAFHGKVDLLVAGYPCQPFSAAGKRAGADDPRHLWPFIRQSIRGMRPRFCFFENVEGHVSLGLSTVLSDLEEDGYRAAWGIFSAAEVGAPHQRKRVFILAHQQQQQGLEGHAGDGAGCLRQVGEVQKPHRSAGESSVPLWPSRPGEPQHCWEPPRVVSQTDLGNDWCRTANRHGVLGYNPQLLSSGGDNHERSHSESTRPFSKSRNTDGDEGRREGWSQTQSPLGRDVDGPADRLDLPELYQSCDNRVDELRLLGNGVVPATAERAWRVLFAELMANA